MPIKNWKTTASNNNSTPPYGAPEGMQKASVNNVMRQIMADVRAYAEEIGWFNWGHTATYINSKTFSVSGDVRDIYVTGIRLKVSLTGKEVFATVKTSALDGNITKITLVEGVLDNTIGEVFVGVSPMIINNIAGTSGLCVSTATNNGNDIELVPYSGFLEADPIRGQILSFYATSNNGGSVKINGKPLKYITSKTKTDLKQNYIKLGKYYEIQYDGVNWVVVKGLETGAAPSGLTLEATLDNGKFFTRKANGDLPTGITADKVWDLNEQKAGGSQPSGKVFVELPIGTVTFKDVAGNASSNLSGYTYTFSAYTGKSPTGYETVTGTADGFPNGVASEKGTGGTLKDSSGTGLFASASAVKANDGLPTTYQNVLPSETRTIIVTTQEDQVYTYTLGKKAPSKCVNIRYRYSYQTSHAGTSQSSTTKRRCNQAGQKDGFIRFSY